MSERQQLIERAEALVKEHMAKLVPSHVPKVAGRNLTQTRYDPSHDWAHGGSLVRHNETSPFA